MGKYTLIIDRHAKMLKVSKASKGMQNAPYTDEVTRYNDVQYTCTKPKPLREKAKQIKAGWIAELESELERVKAIKI